MVWWRSHSRAPLVRSVGPPSSQCRRWWASHQVAGVGQPGKVQCRSRSQSACAWAVVKYRSVSSPVQDVSVGGQDGGDDGAVAGQLPDGLRAEEGAGVDAADQDAGSGPVFEVVQADGDEDGGFCPGWCGGHRGGDGAAADAGRGRRRGVGRWSAGPCPVDHGRFGRGGVDGGFDDGAGFGVEAEPVLGDPAADVVPAGQDGQPAVPVLTSCNSRPRPYRASSAGRTRRTPAGPSTCTHRRPARPRPRRPRPARAAGSAAPARRRRRTPPTPTAAPPSTGDPRPRQRERGRHRRVGELADRLGDQPGLPGVQGRAPVGHPLRHRPRLRRRRPHRARRRRR